MLLQSSITAPVTILASAIDTSVFMISVQTESREHTRALCSFPPCFCKVLYTAEIIMLRAYFGPGMAWAQLTAAVWEPMVSQHVICGVVLYTEQHPETVYLS